MSARKPRSRGKTKADLIDVVYERHGGLTKQEAAEVVDTIFDTLKATLVDGRAVKIQNFGTFEITRRGGRRGVHPGSGEEIFIPARNRLSFRPARLLRERVERSDDDG